METLRMGKIAYTTKRERKRCCKQFAKLKDEKNRTKLLNEAIEQSLSLNQIRARIKEITAQTEQKTVTPQIRTKQLWKEMNKQKPWSWNDKRKKKKW